MKKTYLAIFYISISFVAKAQYFSTGDDPASTKWKQINSDNFQVIYSDDFETKAKCFAAMLDEVYNYGYHTLGTKPKKISVILHSKTITSNGMVGIAPNRMEIYPTPHQEVYSQEWLEQLAIHEFRHVVQTSKLQQELPKILKLLLGEQATALVSGVYLPFWFLEGDAVVTETTLTETGRGRNPVFLMENKAQILEKGQYSYDKITLGSYKDFVPNRYAFGWWMVGGIREKYGSSVWENAITLTAKRPYSLNPLNKVLKKETRFTKEKLYNQLWSDYAKKWQAQIDSIDITKNYLIGNYNNKKYTNYLYTNVLDDGSIISLKKTTDDIPRIIHIKGNEEEILFTPGAINSNSFSATNNKIVWIETRPNLRWTHAAYSKLVIFDIITKKKIEFKTNANLFSPSLNKTETLCLVSAISKDGKSSIQTINIETGDKQNEYQIEDYEYILSPIWNNTETIIYFIALGKDGKQIMQLEIANGVISKITEPIRYDIRNITYVNNNLIYTSAESGVDNIVVLDINSGEVRQITNVKYGADYPTLTKKELYYVNYTADGYKLVKTNREELENIKPKTTKYLLAENLAKDELGLLNFSKLDTTKYIAKPYRKFINLFNFHSWAPVAIDSRNYGFVIPGISLQSQNKLGTSLTNIAYAYNYNEKRGTTILDYSYTGLFPVFNATFSYGGRNVSYYNLENLSSRAQWEELKLNLGISVPLSFSTGKYYQKIQPTIGYILNKTIDSKIKLSASESYQAAYYQLYLSNTIRSSELDIRPRWAQTLQLIYVNNFGKLYDIGKQISISSNLYFPGLFRQHSIRIYNGYQWRDAQRLLSFSDYVNLPRGYVAINTKDIYSLKFSYLMPICYPDFNFGRFLYSKRVYASLFGDYSHYSNFSLAKDKTKFITNKISSFGIELYNEGYILRLPTPITFGLRSTYNVMNNSVGFEFLFSIDFMGI